MHGKSVLEGELKEIKERYMKKNIFIKGNIKKEDLLNIEEYNQIKTTIKSIYDDVVFEENDIEPIMELLIHDKKNEYGNIQFALIEGIGKIKINQSVENDLILKAFQDYKS